MSRGLKIGLTVLVVALVAGAAWWKLGSRPAAAAATATQNTAVVQRGNLQATVNSAGNITPSQQVALNFQQSGVVKTVNVKVGDAVKAGQVLAALDTSDLELQVKNAEVNLKLAQDKLNQAQNPYTSQDVADAQAQVDAAQAALNKLTEGPTPSDVAAAKAAVVSAQAAYTAAVQSSGTESSQLTAAQAAVEKAQVALQQAQAAYDRVKSAPNIAMLPQSTALQQATIDYQSAEADYSALAATAGSDANSKVQQAKAALQQAQSNLVKLQAPATQADIASAQAQLTQAQNNLAKIKAGADATSLDIARNGVEQAQIALQQAQLQLQQAEVVSPIDGVVSVINAVAGQSAPTAATGAFQVSDTSHLEIVLNLAETDVNRVRSNQTAEITLDAIPGATLTGQVSDIAPVGVTQQGVVNYPVTVQLTNTPPGVKPGMTANVNIVIAERDNVLMVPNRAVKVATVNRTGQNGAAGGFGGNAGTPAGANGAAGSGTSGGQGQFSRGQGFQGQSGQTGGQGQFNRGANGAGTNGTGASGANGNFQRRNRQATVTVMQNGKPVQVPVQVGLSNDTMTEIVSGLNEGDTVVINPAAAATTQGGGPGGFGFLGRFGR